MAVPADATAMADLAAVRREQYARYQPVFWRPATGVLARHRAYLASLVGNEKAITLVSEEAGEVTGFLIATLTGAPGAYDPGGPACQIDDLMVAPPARWQSTGIQLLRAGLAEASARRRPGRRRGRAPGPAQARGTGRLRPGSRLRMVGDTRGPRLNKRWTGLPR
jgi:ribosomal protein S18 acetylase RimI-like enzyme